MWNSESNRAVAGWVLCGYREISSSGNLAAELRSPSLFSKDPGGPRVVLRLRSPLPDINDSLSR